MVTIEDMLKGLESFTGYQPAMVDRPIFTIIIPSRSELDSRIQTDVKPLDSTHYTRYAGVFKNSIYTLHVYQGDLMDDIAMIIQHNPFEEAYQHTQHQEPRIHADNTIDLISMNTRYQHPTITFKKEEK